MITWVEKKRVGWTASEFMTRKDTKCIKTKETALVDVWKRESEKGICLVALFSCCDDAE